jgi:hypothetical protein
MLREVVAVLMQLVIAHTRRGFRAKPGYTWTPVNLNMCGWSFLVYTGWSWPEWLRCSACVGEYSMQICCQLPAGQHFPLRQAKVFSRLM